jgi:class 3 adenylate cyclase
MSDRIVIYSMLFADIVGFSKLPDPVYPGFMKAFLEGAKEVLKHPGHPALVSNTWGDAIFAVFATPAEAARAALALQAKAGSICLPGPERTCLQLRIGLHTGPVHEGHDPFTEGPSYMGKHINMAARIEPIAREGHIFVSGEFAAIAALEPGDEFLFDYIGQKPLPKDAGVIPVFRLIAPRASLGAKRP